MNTIAGLCVSTVLSSYIQAALWSTTNPDNEDNDDTNLEGYEVSEDCEQKLREMLVKFLSDNSAVIEKAEILDRLAGEKADQFGFDLWMTQHRHGVGFWEDDTWSEKEGKELTELAQKLPEINLYVNEDGLVDIA